VEEGTNGESYRERQQAMPGAIPAVATRAVDAARCVQLKAKKLPGRRVEAWRRRLVNLVLLLADVLLAFLVWEVAFEFRDLWGREPLSTITVASAAPTVAAWLGSRALLGLYPGYGLDQVEELRRQTYAVLATLTVSTASAFALQVAQSMSRLALGLSLLGLLLFAPLERQLVKWWIMRAGIWGKPVVVLGSGPPGGRVATLLAREWGLGYRPVAVFGGDPAPRSNGFEEIPDEESLNEAVLLSQRHGVDTIIIAMPHTRRDQLVRLVGWASTVFRHAIVIANLGGITNSAVTARNLVEIFGVEIRHNLLDPWAQRVKSSLDLLLTIVGGLLVSPLLIAIAVLIKLDSPGPAFYGHRRVGAGGKHFRCWKFRTMHTNAEQLLDEFLQGKKHLRAEWEQTFKLRDDPRVTRIGRFLRKTSLDELPQLWNVVLGEMSLVGPRPIVDAEIPKYGEVYELYRRVRPGISGLWQVSGRSDTTYPERVEMDSYYVRNWSVWLDLLILVRTAKTVLQGRGAH
jgi:Undecaprenyl-phosphate galactose phosphotransferase WbaP